LHPCQYLQENGPCLAFWKALLSFQQGVEIRPLAAFQDRRKGVVVDFKDVEQADNPVMPNLPMDFVLP